MIIKKIKFYLFLLPIYYYLLLVAGDYLLYKRENFQKINGFHYFAIIKLIFLLIY